MESSQSPVDKGSAPPEAPGLAYAPPQSFTLRINGREHALLLEPRVTLLDALREALQITSAKKGCDRGQCGACTVLVNGERINSCLTLAIMQEGKEIITAEGLGDEEHLHPAQAAFVSCDAFQCGYCTPGQVCSAVALLDELKAGHASAVSLRDPRPGAAVSDADLRERMSGNICRCGAYPNIIAAIRAVLDGAR